MTEEDTHRPDARHGSLAARGFSGDALLEAAIRSDRCYFEAGARLTHTDGFTLATVPGFERMAAGNVGFLDDWPQAGAPLTRRLGDIKALFRTAGAAWVRFYAGAPHPAAREQLCEQGYFLREERAYAFAAVPPGEPAPGLTAVPVRSGEGWAQKLELQRTADVPADGHAWDPSDWTAFERFKSRHSDLIFYLYRDEGCAIATAAVMPVSGVRTVRLKNLFVRGGARRRGTGRDVLRLAVNHAYERDADHLVLLAIAGSAGEKLYRSAGGEVLGSLWEYSKVVDR